MKNIIVEVEANYRQFIENWSESRDREYGTLSTRDNFLQSYKRIASIQSWRECLSTRISKDALAFFAEAQNDALVSHVLAMHGMWRSSLQSLRSLIENIVFCIYYMDHAVEYRQWSQGNHRLSFSHLFDYLKSHPDLINIKTNLDGVKIIKQEWETLSKSVHSSSMSFRMTAKGQFPVLFSSDVASLGAWSTRESHCIYAINLILMALFKTCIQGASMRDLRKAISLVVVKSNVQAVLKKSFGINLYQI